MKVIADILIDTQDGNKILEVHRQPKPEERDRYRYKRVEIEETDLPDLVNENATYDEKSNTISKTAKPAEVTEQEKVFQLIEQKKEELAKQALIAEGKLNEDGTLAK